MRIVKLEHVPFEPTFSGDGYAMSFVHQRVLHDALLPITLEDGRMGVGETVRWFNYSLDEALAAEAQMMSSLEGSELSALPTKLKQWRSLGGPWRGFCFAVETAVLKILSDGSGMSVSSLLGGPSTSVVPEYLSLSSEDPQGMAALVREHGMAYDVVQAKLGVGEVDLDIDRVRQVLSAMRPDQLLLADFNGALEVETGLKWLPKLQDPRLMWEEPCSTYDENVEVASKISAPVMFDQCMKSLATYMRAIEDKQAAAVVLKPALLGSVQVAAVARDACAAARLKMRADGPWCGEVGAWMSLNLAIGVPNDLMIAAIDLTDPINTPNTLIRRDERKRIGPVQVSDLNSIFETAAGSATRDNPTST